MLDLQQDISNLQISQSSNNDNDNDNDNDKFEDITDDFLQITNSDIEFGHIVKSNFFHLIEGTHALEVMNPRLDSALSEYECYGSAENPHLKDDDDDEYCKFDVNKIRNIDEVEWVLKNLVKLIDSWFELNTSLSCNLLSCEYISDILINYKNTKKINYNKFNDDNDNLPMKILYFSCIGLIQFMKFVINLGQAGVIYEEEDLNTQTMNLDFLIDIDIGDTINEILILLNEINDNDVKYDKLKLFLRLILSLLYIPEILNIKVELFKETKDISELTNEFNKAIEIIELLKQKYNDNENDKININEMKHCFNNNIQRKIDNFSCPKEIVLSHIIPNQFFNSISNIQFLFKDLLNMLEIINCKNILELFEFLENFMNFRKDTIIENEDEIIGHHVITRSILQLFIIKDNKSIMGSNSLITTNLLIEYIKSTTGLGTKLFELLNFNGLNEGGEEEFFSQDLKEELIELRFKLTILLNNLESPFINLITTISQNSSRQRQFKIKELVIWDTLHVEAKKFEDLLINLIIKYKNESLTKWLFDDGYTPISLFIYMMKLKTIESIVFKSIELKTSKDLRELKIDYWYLFKNVLPNLSNFSNLINDLINKRQLQLNSLNKKFKKCKAGDKKLKLKNEYYKLNELIKKPLDNLNSFINNKFIKELKIKENLIILQLNLLNQIKIKNSKLFNIPKYSKSNEELLFYLQLKYISSIGVPQQPTFENYKLDNNENNENNMKCLDKDEIINLIESCDILQDTKDKYKNSLKNIIDQLEQIKVTSKVNNISIVYPNNCNSYFPIFTIGV